jgi:cob(I)alamin adenosyltransferase
MVGVHAESLEQGREKEGVQKVGKHTLAYLNRMSSILYALARFANHQAGKVEDAPDYK